MRHVYIVVGLVLLIVAAAPGTTLHISPSGDDGAAGSAEAPMATLAAAVDRLAGTGEPGAVILHEGVYPGLQRIGAADTSPPSKLLIEPARDEQGKYVDAIFDGSIAITSAKAVEGNPGVFAVNPGPFTAARVDPQMWESDTRIRYQYAADLRGVAGRPASFFFEDTTGMLYFRTSDGQGPEAHDIAIERTTVHDRGNFRVHWPNVTLRGLSFRHGVPVSVEADDVTAADCRTYNGLRAFIVSPGKKRARISRCFGKDLANGVMTHGEDTIVEDCT